jgi:hypothetical protein
VPTACNDSVDDDGDTFVGYPTDPGCADIADNDETDPVPAPVCANGMDDDTDGLMDYPADFGCSAASGTSEVFCATETNPISLITTTPTTGSTNAASMNTSQFSSQSCQSNASGADVVYALQLPVPVATLVLDLSGSSFDSIMSLRGASCTSSSEIECDDDDGDANTSMISRNNVPAGTYAVIIDGYSGGNGAYTLAVKGTVAPGTSCSSPLFGTGVLVCPTGTTCTGGTPTCQ